jgi:hypothetical protein
MKILFYLLTLVFGLFGVLGSLRIVEQLKTGQGFLPAPALIAGVMLLLALVCLKKARADATNEQ